MRLVHLAFAALSLTLVPACLIDDKGDEEEVPGDGKDDSFRNPTDHGELVFDEPERAELTTAERHHTWTFALSGDATVDLTTSYAIRGQRRTDTVLYLYKEGPTGWGSYIARNDDYASTTYSQLVRSLGAGRYRALVKGYLATTRGKFKLTVGCEGAGCAPVDTGRDCLFGATYADLPSAPALTLINRNVITAATLPTLDVVDQARLVAAVNESSHTDVTTAAEAIARVDGGEVNLSWWAETAARRTFIAFEYGAGDNSYGAIFEKSSGTLVAAIHDGDLARCSVVAETCRLPEDYSALRADPDFLLISDRVITSAAGLVDNEDDQVLAALRFTYGAELPSIEAGLAMADDHRVNFREYVHNPTNTDMTLVELGAGDTSVGAIYFGRSLQVAGYINDLFIEGCSLFAPLGGHEPGETCRGQGDCVSGVACRGTFAGAGVCVQIAEVPGDGDECTSDAACGSPDLVCGGVTRGYGLCRPSWMRGTFTDEATSTIPDGGDVVRRLVARGLATVDTDVVLRTTIDHPRASQLRVYLANAATTEVLVREGTPADDGHPLVIDQAVGFSGDESVNGEWTLRVVDRVTGQVGRVGPISLTITSRWD